MWGNIKITAGLLFFIGVLLIGGRALIWFGMSPVNNVEEASYIVSVKSGTETSGSLFLGSGNFGGTQYFYVYLQDGNGYRLYKFTASNTTVYEVDYLVKPYLERHYKTTRLGDLCPQTDHYNLYVPKGTIIREFKL